MTDSSDLSADFLKSLEDLDDGDDILLDIRRTLPVVNTTKQDARSIQKLLDQVRAIEKMEKEMGMAKWFVSPFSIDVLPKHKVFFDASANYNEVLFMAGNRVGKSICGAYALSCHVTGDYPDWWEGRRFDHPVDVWAIGKDARAVRDTLQRELLGPPGEWGTGMIPAHRLGKAASLAGVPQGIDTIMIKHKSGGWSTLGFKNYQQDIGSFMGTTRHVVLCDEEVPLEIYNEANVRTATVDGLMLLTFTPLDGLTPLVVNFCKNADYLVGSKPVVAIDQDGDENEQTVGRHRSKAVIQVGWDDVPWLTEAVKARLLEDTPEYMREARSKGLPAMGSGNVFSTPIEEVLVDTFAIPESWPRMYGFDVGWNRTAAVWGALDPATDTLYIYDEHYRGREEPAVHAFAIMSRGNWIPGVIDPASRGRSQVDGKKLVAEYKNLGLNLWMANNEVEAGILALGQRLSARKIKIFKTCINLQKEYMLYRRDKNGKVVKENDHALDALRYVINNLNRMSSKKDHSGFKNMTFKPPRYNI